MPLLQRLTPAVTRRSFLRHAGQAAVAAAAGRAASPAGFSLRYAVASSLYGGL
jgi:hypothetical protein